MALELPNHIRESSLVDAEIKYTWKKPWQCKFEVPRLYNRISPIYGRGLLALSAGFAEWVFWLLNRHTDETIFFEFIEATWASVIDRRYLNHISKRYGDFTEEYYNLGINPLNTSDFWNYKEDLCHSIRGPLFVSIHLLGEAVDLTVPSRQDGATRAVYLSNLAEQIVGKAPEFKKWRKAVVERLIKYHAREYDLDNWMGTPVPREVLDLKYDYKPEMANELLSAFLEKLDPSKNRFLLTSEELIDIGFEGTPYTL